MFLFFKYKEDLVMAIGLIGIIVGMILFLYMVYKGNSPFWSAIFCSLLVAVTNLVPGKPFFEQVAGAITGSYVQGVVQMITALFSYIFLGALLGRLYGDTGAAESIARTLVSTFVIKREGKAKVAAGIIILWILAALCTLGGIDGFVLTFTMFPISLVICEMCNIPRRFIPGIFCLNCAFMTAPGAPQIYNIITEAAIKSQIPIFAEKGAFGIVEQLSSVSATSALVPGLIATLFITCAGVITLIYMINKAMEKGEVFDYGPVQRLEISDRKLPNFIVSLLPLLLVFVLYTLIHLPVFIALLSGILLALITMGRNLPRKDHGGNDIPMYKRLTNTLNAGASNFPPAMFMVATPAGLATVVTATAAFGMIVGMLSGVHIGPIALLIVVVCVIVALTSAPPVALMVALPMVLGIITGPLLATAANAATVTLPVSIHALFRVGAVAASTFETLPINGLIVLGLSLSRNTHKESYLPMFLMTVAYTFIGTLIAAALCMIPGLV
jgi:H+/gluconate symporter-like permease